ncbi:uncharacterized protein K452DRAFT_313315 [Aplosporella prunicola CBS 121167]|uniref:Uncharacterized protein n=1 Tax=Aplosporella prunicola CBS 121167 TaxID=1176127 RepID=A0A6A6AXE4_9PEZI|nr:uncharacterized protein K452DRAFT_313315 [Aplosporella prunicola CBS 121167]KAF2136286.1 hypothetical protein K452DRAFT_313315 [Aplosporella prunicola CBS 121167]
MYTGPKAHTPTSMAHHNDSSYNARTWPFSGDGETVDIYSPPPPIPPKSPRHQVQAKLAQSSLKPDMYMQPVQAQSTASAMTMWGGIMNKANATMNTPPVPLIGIRNPGPQPQTKPSMAKSDTVATKTSSSTSKPGIKRKLTNATHKVRSPSFWFPSNNRDQEKVSKMEIGAPTLTFASNDFRAVVTPIANPAPELHRTVSALENFPGQSNEEYSSLPYEEEYYVVKKEAEERGEQPPNKDQWLQRRNMF